MSHFVVMVIGENVEAQLQPYHEFECTGTNDQYVQDIDITDKRRAEFENYSIEYVRMDNGALVDKYDREFYRDFTDEELARIRPLGTGSNSELVWHSDDWHDGRGYRPRVHCPPKDKIVTRRAQEIMSFAEYLKRDGVRAFIEEGDDPKAVEDAKYGYAVVWNGEVVKVVDRTNPNAKWDWWTVGGRYSQYYRAKDGDEFIEGEKFELDITATKEKARLYRTALWQDAQSVIADAWPEDVAAFVPWTTLYENKGERSIDALRQEYRDQKLVRVWNDETRERKLSDLMWENPDAFVNVSLEDYIRPWVTKAGTPFAFVKDGQWHERGEMGWWAAVSNEMDEDTWATKFFEMFDALPDSTPITIVDCHI